MRREDGFRTVVAMTLVAAAIACGPQPVSAENSVFVPIQPCRIVDTRFAVPIGPIPGGTTRAFNVVGIANYSPQGGSASGCGIPGFSSGLPTVTAIAVNVVAVDPQAKGNLLLYPTGTTPGSASTLNFPNSTVVPLNIANAVIVAVRQDLQGNDLSVRPNQATQVVLDVTGYFTPLAVRTEPVGSGWNLIGGAAANNVAAGGAGATIAGGGHPDGPNHIEGTFGTIGGGVANSAAGESPVVGGGQANQASGATTTVSGGYSNVASGDNATIAGGKTNTASGTYSSIVGGFHNRADGTRASVLGGEENEATGSYSVALGRRAKSADQGIFTFADSSDFDFTSNTANSFRVRATGGVRFVTAIDGAGATTKSCLIDLSANVICSGTFTAGSDVHSKTDIVPVDPHAVLKKVAAMPISTWRFKTDEKETRHVGPMAQDFRAAFALGHDDRHIASVDADGVAFAAIQALHAISEQQKAKISEQDAKLQAQAAEIRTLRAAAAGVKALEARLVELEKRGGFATREVLAAER